MRRRFMAAVLALALAVSLCSCGKEETQTTTSVVEETSVERSIEAEEVSALAQEEQEEVQQEEIQQEEIQQEEIQQEIENSVDVSDNANDVTENARPVVAGKVEGNEYTNGFFGIGCTLDDSWEMISSDMLAQFANYSEEAIAESSDGSPQVHAALDMMASSGLMDSIMVMVMDIPDIKDDELKLPEGDELGEINDELADYFGSLEEEFRAIGLDNIKTEYSNEKFAGYEALCMEFSGSYHMEEEGFSMNLEFFEKVAIIKIDSYVMAVITLSSLDDRCDEYMGMFYTVANQA